MTPMQESLNAAQELIDELLERHGKDYTKHKEKIAEDLFLNGIFNGNWDSRTDLNDSELEDLRVIQEDEYDQHMEDDEKPAWGSMICSLSPGVYVWFAYS